MRHLHRYQVLGRNVGAGGGVGHDPAGSKGSVLHLGDLLLHGLEILVVAG